MAGASGAPGQGQRGPAAFQQRSAVGGSHHRSRARTGQDLPRASRSPAGCGPIAGDARWRPRRGRATARAAHRGAARRRTPRLVGSGAGREAATARSAACSRARTSASCGWCAWRSEAWRWANWPRAPGARSARMSAGPWCRTIAVADRGEGMAHAELRRRSRSARAPGRQIGRSVAITLGPRLHSGHLWGETPMWGTLESRPRAARLLVCASLLLTLAACATHHDNARPPAPTTSSATPRGERDATGAYRAQHDPERPAHERRRVRCLDEGAWHPCGQGRAGRRQARHSQRQATPAKTSARSQPWPRLRRPSRRRRRLPRPRRRPSPSRSPPPRKCPCSRARPRASRPPAKAEGSQPFNTPSSWPMRINASIARSRCSRVCAALICVRMRAWPLGTTGKKKPIA